jgi:signal transduction histidine kinase/CheY-like chemotaxis protein
MPTSPLASSDPSAVRRPRRLLPLSRLLLPGAAFLAIASTVVFALIIAGQMDIAKLARDTRDHLLPMLTTQHETARDVERLILFGEELINSPDPAKRKRSRLAAQMLVFDQGFQSDPQTQALGKEALDALIAIAKERDRRDGLADQLQHTLLQAETGGMAGKLDGGRVRPLLVEIVNAGSVEVLNAAVLKLQALTPTAASPPIWQRLADLKRELLIIDRNNLEAWEKQASRLKGVTDTLAAQADMGARNRSTEIENEAGMARRVALFGLAGLAALFFGAAVWGRIWIVKPMLDATRMLERAPRQEEALREPRTIIAEVGSIVAAAHAFAESTRALDEERRKVVQVRLEAAAAREKDLQELVEQRTRELDRAKVRAEAANEAKSAFLANMSHELRTPLNAILGFSNLMLRSVAEPRDREHLDIINRSGEHLLQLINDVLDMSKIEAHRATVNPTTFDLPALLRDVVAMVGASAAAAGIQLSIEGAVDLPVYVRCDSVKLRQILINLLGNAVKFTREGGIVVRAEWLESLSPATRRLAFTVEDSGIGIADGDLERIFRPFEQVSAPAENKGSGLGLAIARQFAELMGGTLTAKSRPQVGSQFRLELPVEVVEAADLPAPSTSGKVVVGLVAGQPRYRILIVDDNAYSRLLLARELSAIGLDVREASDGVAGVACFTEWHPHLIWMDWRMPNMDGIEATRRIRAMADGSHVKIIGLTASAFEERDPEFQAAGCNGNLRKPYRIGEILDEMARHLDLRYRYQDEAEGLSGADEDSDTEGVSMDTLPVEWIGALHEAARLCDYATATRLVANIKAIHPTTGCRLEACLARFDWQGLRACLGPSAENRTAAL